jgi:hypothetical protein
MRRIFVAKRRFQHDDELVLVSRDLVPERKISQTRLRGDV